MDEPTIEHLKNFLKGNLTQEEARTIQQWLDRHKITKATLEHVISLPEGAKSMLMIDPEEDWPKVEGRIKREKQVFMNRLYRAAAVFAILCIAFYALFTGQQLSIFGENMITVVNEGRDEKKVQLPDSS